jgi:hypothetical protein
MHAVVAIAQILFEYGVATAVATTEVERQLCAL